MRFSVLILLAALFAAPPMRAETMTCTTLVEHTEADTQNPWQTVNDNVMGGRSSGGSALQESALVFSGSTNTNGGGFSSIRLDVPRGAMAEAQLLRVHMKRDARAYSVTLRTNARSFGRRIAFRGPINGAPEGEWGVGVVDLSTLKASIWGRDLPNAVFDASEVVEIGLIIYDGEDGPFEMQLSRIEACR